VPVYADNRVTQKEQRCLESKVGDLPVTVTFAHVVKSDCDEPLKTCGPSNKP
jgi:hypothetical protein